MPGGTAAAPPGSSDSPPNWSEPSSSNSSNLDPLEETSKIIMHYEYNFQFT